MFVVALASDVEPGFAPGPASGAARRAWGCPRPGTRYARRGSADVRVVVGRTRAVQAFARACAVASGTATLETALFGTPLAIVYRVGWLNYAIARAS